MSACRAGRVFAEFQQKLKRLRDRQSWDKISLGTNMILSLIGEGLSDKEISVRIGIAVRTVEGHRSMIMRKLDLPALRLIAFALERSLVRQPLKFGIVRTICPRHGGPAPAADITLRRW